LASDIARLTLAAVIIIYPLLVWIKYG
jgi:hypothetical protein